MGLAISLPAATGAALAAIALLAPLHPATAEALLVLVPAPLAWAAGSVAEGVPSRRIDFRLIARLEVLRVAVDAGVAVALAWWGLGAAALAAGMPASRAAAAIALVALGGHGRALRPRFGRWGRSPGSGCGSRRWTRCRSARGPC